MLKKYLYFNLLLFICCAPAIADSSVRSSLASDPVKGYWVFFSDKDGVEFDPHAFFHPAAIERRLQHGLCLYDPVDQPVRNDYLQALATLVDTVRMVSRWFNAARVQARPCQVMALEQLPFVREIRGSQVQTMPAAAEAGLADVPALSQEMLEQMLAQVNAMEGTRFHDHGYDGSGLRIAVLDGGFSGVDTHPAFRHLLENQRIVKTWDFHRNREDVFRYNQHGTMVLSVLGGLHENLPIGLATGAEFLLARTEIWREPFFEEEYWLAAVEWADRHGAHIINSSLGYSYHRYFPEEMDGKTSLVAEAAAIAFRKGMLVMNSAGNSGADLFWRVVTTPADSPYVLAVGAVDHSSLLGTTYTSRGPTADGRLKPNVTAVGNVVAANRRGFTITRGTSFSSPLVAGFAACLWQMFPSWTNRQLFDAIQNSGHLHPYYDLIHGFGIPQAGYFFEYPGSITYDTFDFVQDNGSLVVVLRGSNPAQTHHSPLDGYVYYHIRNADGKIEQYYVVEAEKQEVLNFLFSDFGSGQRLMVHYRGFSATWTF
jgi:serine protease AprX